MCQNRNTPHEKWSKWWKNQNFLKFAESFRNHSRIKKLLQKAFSEWFFHAKPSILWKSGNQQFLPWNTGKWRFQTFKFSIFHADACVRCCAGSPWFPLHGAKHSLCHFILGWPPAETAHKITWPQNLYFHDIYLA